MMTTDAFTTTLWLGATRYYLGRMSYAVGDFTEGLRRAWPELPAKTRTLIERDVEEAFQRDDAARACQDYARGYRPLGMDCDRQSWETVRELWK